MMRKETWEDHILQEIQVQNQNATFAMKVKAMWLLMDQGEPKLCSILHVESLQKCHPMRGSKNYEEKVIASSAYFLVQEKIKESIMMGYDKGISYVSINHMADSQERNMYWYVMGIEIKRKIKISYKCIKIDVFQSNNNYHYFQKTSNLPST